LNRLLPWSTPRSAQVDDIAFGESTSRGPAFVDASADVVLTGRMCLPLAPAGASATTLAAAFRTPFEVLTSG
jgi:hypothetical protein